MKYRKLIITLGYANSNANHQNLSYSPVVVSPQSHLFKTVSKEMNTA